MIKLLDCSQSRKCNYIYTDHFPGQKRAMILLLKHYSEDNYAQQILEKVLCDVIRLDLDSLAFNEIPAKLEQFFIEINWRIFSFLSQRPDLERGISLNLVVIENSEFYQVQFGRYFSGLIDDKQFIEIGRPWEDLRIKSVEGLNLLGSIDRDIRVKVEKCKLVENSYLLIVGSERSNELKELGIHYLSIAEHINHLKLNEYLEFVLLKNWQQKAHNTNPWIRRRRVNRTALILIILIIISAAYVYYGGNLIDDLFSRIKFSKTEFTRNDLKGQFFRLQEQAEELLNELSREDMLIELLPSQEISMETDWEREMSSEITNPPCFDHKNIYFSSGNNLYALGKNKSEIIWQREFSSKLEVLRLVDANRILVALTGGKICCLDRNDGTNVWQKDEIFTQGSDSPGSLSQISLNQYRQLEDSVLLIYEGRHLSLSLVRTGEVVAEYENSGEIDYISEYDMLERCIYLVSGKKLKKIKIRVII